MKILHVYLFVLSLAMAFEAQLRESRVTGRRFRSQRTSTTSIMSTLRVLGDSRKCNRLGERECANAGASLGWSLESAAEF